MGSLGTSTNFSSSGNRTCEALRRQVVGSTIVDVPLQQLSATIIQLHHSQPKTEATVHPTNPEGDGFQERERSLLQL